jgi:acyl-CoA thioester hydrolase
MTKASGRTAAAGARLAVHRHAIVVSEGDLDENAHANNVRYVQWMQDAAICHADLMGCSSLVAAEGAAWVARSHTIEYLRPAFLGDRVSVLTWVSSHRRVRSLRKYAFVRDADGAVLARGETDWVLVDARSGKPRNIPEAVARTFALVPPDEEP